MKLSIKALRYFLIAAEQRSIVRAAELLNVVPSAVASAVDSVEQAFELKLVQRYPAKGISPTASGLALMAKIRHTVEEYDNLILEGTELKTAISGHISIGYYAPIAPAFIPDITKGLMRDNPDVRFSFIECDNDRAQSGLLNGEFDIIVFVAENVRAGIHYETLIEVPPFLLVPDNHAFVTKSEVTFADLSGQPLVLLDLPFTSEYYRKLIDEHSVEVSIVATATTTEMVRSLVGAGIGCSILNMRPATDISYAGDGLTSIPFERSLAKPLKLVLGHLGGNRRRLVQRFSDECSHYFNSAAAKKLIVSDDACGEV